MLLNQKQEQAVGDNSQAYNAGQDITINNQGLSLSDTKTLIMDVFELNFPKILEKAEKQAKHNFDLWANDFVERIKDNIHFVDLNNFADPFIQSLIAELSCVSAKRGCNLNIEILNETFINLIMNLNNDYINVLISEALSIIPKITKNQLEFIETNFWMNYITFDEIEDISEIDPYIISSFDKNNLTVKHISNSEEKYLMHLGIFSEFSLGNAMEGKFDSYCRKKFDIKYLSYSQSSKIPKTLALFKKIRETHKLMYGKLSPIGNIIGISTYNLKNTKKIILEDFYI